MEFLIELFSYYSYLPLIILALIFSIVASIKVKTTFSKYNKIRVGRNITSNQVVRQIFMDNGIDDVRIMRTAGSLTDNFNPKTMTLNLSDSTYESPSIGAIGVAAHEAGHAVQHQVGYAPIKLRSLMVPVVNFGSRFGVIIAILGLIAASEPIVNIGIVLYALTFVFTLVTLPVEFNASRRAISAIKAIGGFTEDEIKGMEKVLRAAAMTYVASMFSALVSLLRFISIFGGRRRD